MHEVAARAADVLTHHPHPALLLGELLQLVAEAVDRTLTSDRLRLLLSDYPGDFRFLDSRGASWPASSAGAPDGVDTWVLGSGMPVGAESGDVSMRLRESVRWLGRGIDSRSRMDVSRWHAIALSERRSRVALRQALGGVEATPR